MNYHSGTPRGLSRRDGPRRSSDLSRLGAIVFGVSVGVLLFVGLGQQALAVVAYVLIALGYLFWSEAKDIPGEDLRASRLEGGVAFAVFAVFLVLYVVLLGDELATR
jgi:hypothetical protein